MSKVEFRTVRVFDDGVKRPAGTLATEEEDGWVLVSLARINSNLEPCWDKEEGRRVCMERLDSQREHPLYVNELDTVHVKHPAMARLLKGRTLLVPKHEMGNLVTSVRTILSDTETRFRVLNRTF
jgi:hypothetical protein